MTVAGTGVLLGPARSGQGHTRHRHSAAAYRSIVWALYHSGPRQVVGEAADARIKVCLREDWWTSLAEDRSRLSLIGGVAPRLGYGLRFATTVHLRSPSVEAFVRPRPRRLWW